MNHIVVQRTVLFAAVVFSFFVGLGAVPLFDKDEGAFCEATREMIASGNYLMTYVNDVPRYDKPILIYWLQAASVSVFGLNEFALRLPSALAAALWAWATWWFVRKVLDANKAFYTTFFLITALQVTIIAKAAIADAVLNLFIALTMFNLYLYYQSVSIAAVETGNEGPRHWQRRATGSHYLYAAMAAMGLGFLTKGPVAILIPFGALFFFCLAQRNLRAWPRMFFNPIGLVIFFAITAPWYIAAVSSQGWPILAAWYKQTLGRMHKPLEGHSGGYFYYFPVVIGGIIPYTALLFIVLRRVRSDIKTPLNAFLLLWFAFTFVFFSFSGTKLPHYVIYGYTGLFILMAIHMDKLKKDTWLLLPVMGFLAVLILLPYIVPLVLPRIKDVFTREVIEETLPKLGLKYQAPMMVGLAVCTLLLLIERIPRAITIPVLGLMVVGLMDLHIMPLVARITQDPIKEAALLAKAKDYDVYMWKINMPSFIFYRQKLLPKGIPHESAIVLSKMPLLRRLGELEVLYEKNGIGLVRVKHLENALVPLLIDRQEGD